jgi:hypothetical protein
MYCQKLNLNFEINDFKIEKYITSFKLNEDNEIFKGITYHAIDNSNNHLLDIIPNTFKNSFSIFYLTINCPIRPHIDHGPKTSINFYLESNNYKTTFYSFIDESKPKKIPLDTNNLTEVDSFIANDNEVWILNISKPHSVLPINKKSSERTAICLQTKLEYNTVLKILEKNQNKY